MKRFIFTVIAAAIIVVSPLFARESDTPPAFIPQLVKLYSPSDLDSLRSSGAEILRRRGDIVICLVPNKERAQSPRQKPRKISPALDIARTHFSASAIQDGSATGIPYTGKGVVVGLCDLGFDPSHPTFRDANGNSRVKRVTHYSEYDGIRNVLEGEDEYMEWGTDTQDEFHATHVCGILAGNGAGSPYSGIAPDADIVASLSSLTEAGLLAGAEDIIEYARETGRPAVINMSVGCYTGPHDGSSLFSQYLDMCADDAIIVLSAGNEGTSTNTLISSLSQARQSVAFRIGNTAWTQYEMLGEVEIWSGSSQPLTLTLMVYDCVEKKVTDRFATFTLDGGEKRSFEWSEDDPFPFSGRINAEGGVSRENGRHRNLLTYDFQSPEKSNGSWARYEFAVEITAGQDSDVEVYADGIHARLMSMPGNPAASPVRSISDLACGSRVISVGMYGNRTEVPVTDSASGETTMAPTGYSPGSTVCYSSYGTLRDGRVLPLTVAPGAPLVSAISGPYLEAHPDTPHLDIGTRWVSEPGTSMASPYVAGYIATWLEAAPGLTPEDIIDIIAESNRTDIPDASDPHNGAGWFDPVQGLRIALRKAGVDSVTDPLPLLRPDDHVAVYTPAGAKIYAGKASGLSGIPKGLYIIHTPYGSAKRAL